MTSVMRRLGSCLLTLGLVGCPQPEPEPPRAYEFTRYDCDADPDDVTLERLAIDTEEMAGPQGGTHINWQLTFVAGRLPSCIEFTLTEGLTTGRYRLDAEPTVETIDEREVHTADIVGSDFFASADVEVSAYGLTARPRAPHIVGHDAGLDAGTIDAGSDDAGAMDAGVTDADVDAGDTDAGDTDAGDTDAGDTDAGDTDAGDTDAGDVDAG